ncbi:hypothetical protein GLOIN_2v1549660 [Rhizophagus irregularis DAOM 181602=DAOM 197198]|uniref:Uncharacterized protein n=1 Tax=Rhizophagus irregularis (strain DAOM 181602 / DAOM 197198 / MUCL 43194) TaxID=747089 RepID=A0A2P4QHQ6_RHIID|nr:hypothetical protein GLOIN_2v1549660 [Rhizophagus irregularis DAOM 181602=DAOM 197198]POG77150.1 hypothetical protein GLOIN_2v1549660 [Rhizophagus irregularis DAOM 181602=DAOM 197198]|eukprot:XP_025184016.1 hypothetical protein GLOIN_2v1549660 [Rhizophagus irregularis DAOM 181602=DAOM 197198]
MWPPNHNHIELELVLCRYYYRVSYENTFRFLFLLLDHHELGSRMNELIFVYSHHHSRAPLLTYL